VKAPKELSAALGSWIAGFLLQLVLIVRSAEIRVFGALEPVFDALEPDFGVQGAVRREPECRRWGGCRALRPATGFGTGTEPVGVVVAANGWRCSKSCP
jgi:hypothetical protein